MAYRVLEYFEDLQDNGRAYHAGDKYPREGYEPSESRISELAGTHNRRGIRLIEIEAEKPVPKKRTRKKSE